MTLNHGIVKTRELKPAEYRRFLDDVSKNEDVIKIKNGIYATLDALANDTFDIESILPMDKLFSKYIRQKSQNITAV